MIILRGIYLSAYSLRTGGCAIGESSVVVPPGRMSIDHELEVDIAMEVLEKGHRRVGGCTYRKDYGSATYREFEVYMFCWKVLISVAINSRKQEHGGKTINSEPAVQTHDPNR